MPRSLDKLSPLAKCLTKAHKERSVLARWPNRPIIYQKKRLGLGLDEREQKTGHGDFATRVGVIRHVNPVEKIAADIGANPTELSRRHIALAAPTLPFCSRQKAHDWSEVSIDAQRSAH